MFKQQIQRNDLFTYAKEREKYICDVTWQTYRIHTHTNIYVRIIIHNTQTIHYCDVYMKNAPPRHHRSNFPNQDNYTANFFWFVITRRRKKYSCTEWRHWFLWLILIFKHYFGRAIILNDQQNAWERFQAQRIKSYFFYI